MGELAIPHLPGGRDSEIAENFTWYALCASAGVAAQGVFLLEPALSLQTIAHLVGALGFFYGAWCQMSAAGQLYRPEAHLPPEDSDGWAAAQELVDAAAVSQLLLHPTVVSIVSFRHSILMRAPVALFVVPLISQLTERAPAQATESGGQSPATRSMMGLMQWLVVFNFALIFISYGPELTVAALMPLPTVASE